MIINQTPYPISFEREMSQAITCRYGEEMRQYIFKPDVNVSGLSCLLQIAKPDGTFTENGVEVHTDPDTGECTLVITIPQQATVVKGVARYSICCYGEVETETHLLYSAEGPLWVDDKLVTEDMIESVAEVYGLRFPQDFLTVDNLVDIVNYVSANLINDEIIAENTTWSSHKIDQELSSIEPEPITATEHGNPIEIDDSAAAPLVKCVTAITGYQSGTGTPSPDNIRPIVAYTEGEIEVRGKNFADISNDTTGSNQRATVSYEDGGVVVTATGTYGRYGWVIPIENGTYSLSFKALTDLTGQQQCVYLGSQDGTWNTTASGYIAKTSQFTSTEKLYKLENITVTDGKIFIGVYATTTGTSGSVVLKNIMLNKGSSATTYEPYTSTTHTTTFPSAIYRGSEDVVNGTAVTEWGMIASYNGETLPGEWISDRDEYAPGTTPTTGAQVAYELATPSTSSVTPTNLPIRTLSDYTHIESSTGDMEIEYITEIYQPLVDLIQISSHVYSTEEHIVGKWIDGRNVYEKSWEFDSYVYVGAYSTVSLASKGVTISDLGFFVNAICISGVDKRVHFPVAVGINNNEIRIQNETGSSMAIDKIVLQYTKTS